MTVALEKLGQAERMLAEAKTLEDIKKIQNLAAAAETYARAAKLGHKAQNHAAEIKLRAERKAGELLVMMERGVPKPGGRTMPDVGHSSEYAKVLSETNTTRQDASRWQAEAAIPAERFEAYIAENKETSELTTAGLLNSAEGEDGTMTNGGIILDLCGGTGAWSKPYADAGYDVTLITLPEHDVTKAEFFRNFLEFGGLYVDIVQVCGILAAPPCTEFSLAKGSAPRDFESAMVIVKACLEIIWHCRAHSKSNLRFWALENPTGFLRQFLGKPAYTFEQWQFGDEGIKRTDLWGYFNLPAPTVRTKPKDLTVRFPNGRSNGRGMSKPPMSPGMLAEYGHLKLNRSDLRAITPPGFAQAFFRANHVMKARRANDQR